VVRVRTCGTLTGRRLDVYMGNECVYMGCKAFGIYVCIY
jgi:hypothetical protein